MMGDEDADDHDEEIKKKRKKGSQRKRSKKTTANKKNSGRKEGRTEGNGFSLLHEGHRKRATPRAVLGVRNPLPPFPATDISTRLLPFPRPLVARFPKSPDSPPKCTAAHGNMKSGGPKAHT